DVHTMTMAKIVPRKMNRPFQWRGPSSPLAFFGRRTPIAVRPLTIAPEMRSRRNFINEGFVLMSRGSTTSPPMGGWASLADCEGAPPEDEGPPPLSDSTIPEPLLGRTS